MSSVSVILPTYNRAGYLGQAIQSALGQTHPPLEIIVVDDGSTDETEHVCQSFPPPVRYVRQQNAGVAAARNRGAEEARGEYLAFLDSDDVWKPNKLADQLAAHRTAPRAGWSMTDFEVILPDGTPRSARQGFRGGFPVFDDLGVTADELFARSLTRATLETSDSTAAIYMGDCYDLLFEGNFVQPTGFMVKRNVMAATAGFDRSLQVASDTEFFHRLAAVSDGVILMKRLYGWRIGHTECLTTTSNTPRLIETGLLSLERAALLRPSLSPYAESANQAAQRRLRLKLAYARLADLDGRGARATLQRGWGAGDPLSVRSMGIYVASLIPAPLLAGLGILKRSFISTA